MARPIESLQFDNTYTQLPETFHQAVFPTALRSPWLAAFSPEAAELIDLDPAESARPEFVEQIAGCRPWPGAWPIAQAYAGHQFGNYVPRLGDGRAILMGEACAAKPQVWNRYRGLSGRKWDVQLKGAGRTAFSRQFDGRAVLRSCLREFLASEAMAALGVPTTRALAVVGSQEPVFREQPEPGAILVRLAPSHVRFGTFEYFYFGKKYAELQQLADYCLHHYFPDQARAKTPYADALMEIVVRTAELIAHWQAHGFVHGVMNTDNFSILGITLDYGPFGFMESFDPRRVSNHSDPEGVYAFANQPEVGFFNVQCLVRAWSPLLTREQAHSCLEAYEPALARCYLGLMADKLGLMHRRDTDEDLIHSLLKVLRGEDYTIFFRELAGLDAGDPAGDSAWLRERQAAAPALAAWMTSYRARLQEEGSRDEVRRRHMLKVNPRIILRNSIAQEAIEAASRGDASVTESLRKALMQPFGEASSPDEERWSQPAAAGTPEPVISCSS